MCNPAVAVMGAMMVAQLGFQYAGQKQAADAEVAYQEDVAQQQNDYILANAEAANDAYIEQAGQVNRNLAQAQESASVELQELQRQRLRAQGTAEATSEGAGLSFDALVRDFGREEARYRDVLRTQLGWDFDQGAYQIESLRRQAVSTANSARPYTPTLVQQPSLFGTALKAGAGVASLYNKYYSDNEDETSGRSHG